MHTHTHTHRAEVLTPLSPKCNPEGSAAIGDELACAFYTKLRELLMRPRGAFDVSIRISRTSNMRRAARRRNTAVTRLFVDRHVVVVVVFNR